jgi:hypothetical protein
MEVCYLAYCDHSTNTYCLWTNLITQTEWSMQENSVREEAVGWSTMRVGKG